MSETEEQRLWQLETLEKAVRKRLRFARTEAKRLSGRVDEDVEPCAEARRHYWKEQATACKILLTCAGMWEPEEEEVTP